MPPIVAALLLGAFAAPLPAQAEAEPDRVYLIRDVARWTGAGTEAERGSLLIQDGHVQWSATGFDAADYPEARIIDAEDDWIVYPAGSTRPSPASSRSCRRIPTSASRVTRAPARCRRWSSGTARRSAAGCTPPT